LIIYSDINTEHIAAAIGECVGVSTYSAIGGTSVADDVRHIRNGVHVLCGTPGRIMDLIRRNVLNTSAVTVLVLDEVCAYVYNKRQH
jgi:superfamily II DNA/RNA helicase